MEMINNSAYSIRYLTSNINKYKMNKGTTNTTTIYIGRLFNSTNILLVIPYLALRNAQYLEYNEE